MSICTHFCGGHEVKSELGLVETKLDCGMQEAGMACEYEYPNSKKGFHQKKCCEDELKSIQLSDAFNKRAGFDLPVFQFESTSPFPIEILPTFSFAKEFTISDRAPPDVDRNILTLYQTFLI